VIQVVLGHMYFERNLPNIISNDTEDISYLAMCQSVLIAWSTM
jgi:hypothetical protein